MKKLLLLLLALVVGIVWIWLGRQRPASPAPASAPTSIPIVRKVAPDSPAPKQVHPVLPATHPHAHFTTLTH